MTRDDDVPAPAGVVETPPQTVARSSPPALANGLAGGRRPCTNCGRSAQRDKPTCWFCDPDVSPEVKLAARKKGAQLETLLVLSTAVVTSLEGRDNLRERLLALKGAGKITSSELRDYLAVVDSAARDPGRPKVPAEDQPKPLEVLVTKFSSERVP